MTGAGETKLGLGCTNVLEGHLEVENTTADERENQSGDHLTGERVPWRDLGVMGELQIVGEIQCLVARDVSVSLEPDECVGVA